MFKSAPSIILAFALSIAITTTTHAQSVALDIGRGYNCFQKNVVRSGRLTNSSKLRSKLIRKITSLRALIRNLNDSGASPLRIQAAKQKLRSLRSTERLVKRCVKGAYAEPLTDVFAALSGNYTGSYEGRTLPHLFSGDISASISVNGDLVSTSFQATGILADIFGSGVTTLEMEVPGVTIPLTLQLTNTGLGPIDITVPDPSQVSVNARALPTGALLGITRLKLDVHKSGTDLVGTLTAFAGSTAIETIDITLTKQS